MLKLKLDSVTRKFVQFEKLDIMNIENLNLYCMNLKVSAVVMLYEGSKKSGSKIAVEESSSGRRLRSKILRPVEESSTSGRRIFERSLRPWSSLFVRTIIQTGTSYILID